MDKSIADIINTREEKLLKAANPGQDSVNLTNVRQGIIWAQILDKPRAKNPYFLMRRI